MAASGFIEQLTVALRDRNFVTVDSTLVKLQSLPLDAVAEAITILPSNQLFLEICHIILGDDGAPDKSSLFAWMYELIDCGSTVLGRFVIQFIPVLLWTYLSRDLASLATPGIGVVLMGLCRVAGNECGTNGIWHLDTIGDLSAGSIYRAAKSEKDRKAITLSDLRNHDLRSQIGATDDNNHLAPVKDSSPASRMALVQSVLCLYISRSPNMPKESLQQFCVAAALFCASDSTDLETSLERLEWKLDWKSALGPKNDRGFFPLSSIVLQELLRGVFHCIHLVHTHDIAVVALKALHERGSREINAELLLSTSPMMAWVDEYY